MNCDCVNRIEKELPAFAKAGEGATALCEATAFGITEDMGVVMHLTIPFRVTGTVKPYNKKNGHVVPFTAGYCPICGRNAKRYQVGKYDGLEPTFTEPK